MLTKRILVLWLLSGVFSCSAALPGSNAEASCSRYIVSAITSDEHISVSKSQLIGSIEKEAVGLELCGPNDTEAVVSVMAPWKGKFARDNSIYILGRLAELKGATESDLYGTYGYFSTGAAKGCPICQYRVALYEMRDVEKSELFNGGIASLFMAARNGVPEAMYRMAELHFEGKYLEKDIEAAKNYAEKALAAGVVSAGPLIRKIQQK